MTDVERAEKDVQSIRCKELASRIAASVYYEAKSGLCSVDWGYINARLESWAPAITRGSDKKFTLRKKVRATFFIYEKRYLYYCVVEGRAYRSVVEYYPL